MSKVLVVEDDKSMRRFLRTSLGAQGYEVVDTTSGGEGIAKAATIGPDLVLLDIGLPDMSGLDVIVRIREWTQMPIIVLSAREEEREKVAALDAGADDYLTKPFGVDELLARIRVVRRHVELRGSAVPAKSVDAGGVTIDLATRSAAVDGRHVHLTPTEWKLLALLVQNAGKVVTQGLMLEKVWGPQGRTPYLHVYMQHLRVKLERDPARPALIVTEAGVGYRFRLP